MKKARQCWAYWLFFCMKHTRYVCGSDIIFKKKNLFHKQFVALYGHSDDLGLAWKFKNLRLRVLFSNLMNSMRDIDDHWKERICFRVERGPLLPRFPHMASPEKGGTQDGRHIPFNFCCCVAHTPSGHRAPSCHRRQLCTNTSSSRVGVSTDRANPPQHHIDPVPKLKVSIFLCASRGPRSLHPIFCPPPVISKVHLPQGRSSLSLCLLHKLFLVALRTAQLFLSPIPSFPFQKREHTKPEKHFCSPLAFLQACSQRGSLT